MNIYTKRIMALLGVDAETADRIQDLMDCDFSECNNATFDREARLTWEFIQSDERQRCAS